MAQGFCAAFGARSGWGRSGLMISSIHIDGVNGRSEAPTAHTEAVQAENAELRAPASGALERCWPGQQTAPARQP
jgi:hypothetical protein